jgi:hypothetical protein
LVVENEVNTEEFSLDTVNSPEFKWLAESKRYLLAAEVLRKSDEYKRNGLLITPTLHLIAHGIELFLKASLIKGGASENDARKFSHNIMGLWEDSRNEETRSDVMAAAQAEWEAARDNQHWQDDFNAFEGPPLVEYLRKVSELHSKATDYALRYINGRTSSTVGPKPHLLSATFYRVVDSYIRDLSRTIS